MQKTRVLIFLTALFITCVATARHKPASYGIVISDSLKANAKLIVLQKMQELSAGSYVFSHDKPAIMAFETPHVSHDKTIDFYLLLLLCIIVGIVRYADHRYFTNLWRVCINPGQSSAAKEQIEVSALPNIVLNFLFVVTAGAYVYYLMARNKGYIPSTAKQGKLLLLLICGLALVYIVKYMVIRFSGWAFKIQHITEEYTFNVFLMNKVLAIILIPFVIILAFASVEYAHPVVICSFIIIGIAFINRYLRSWRVFGSFFQYSKFHFFTYLCASEILPMAVFMKLLVDGAIL